jgi:hypothetical protein
MSSVFIPKPLYPNVPPLPGVPQLVRKALTTAEAVLLPIQAALDTGLLIRQLILFASTQAPVWGIFDSNGNRVISPDSIYAFNDRQEWRESDYPVEGGGFSTFNKVIVPFENGVRLTKGGSLADRTAFLKTVDMIAPLTTVYQIRTPEKTYLSVNVLRVELLRRSSEGAYFLEVDMTFRNVKVQNAQYSSTAANTANAQNPSAIPFVNKGNVQPSSVSTQTAAQAAAALVQAPF